MRVKRRRRAAIHARYVDRGSASPKRSRRYVATCCSIGFAAAARLLPAACCCAAVTRSSLPARCRSSPSARRCRRNGRATLRGSLRSPGGASPARSLDRSIARSRTELRRRRPQQSAGEARARRGDASEGAGGRTGAAGSGCCSGASAGSEALVLGCARRDPGETPGGCR